MKKILFPTDFSEMSLRAFAYTAALARVMPAEIVVFHASDDEEALSSVDFSVFDAWEEDEELSISFHQESGRFMPSILRHMETPDSGYDLIVMGTKGSYGLHEVFLDSNTVDLLHQLSIHLLAVPDEATFDGELDRGVIVSKCRAEDAPMVAGMVSWLSAYIAEVRVVHMDLAHTDEITGRVDAFKDMMAELGYPRIQVDSVWTTDVEQDLTTYCQAHQIDMVALAHKHANPMSRLVYADLASRLTNHLHLPVFTYIVSGD